jgi:hypothetical protein
LPAFFTQALPRRGTPFDTGRRLFLVDISAAFPALYAELIGEHLHFSAAIRAFIQRRTQIPDILTGAPGIHRIFPFLIIYSGSAKL